MRSICLFVSFLFLLQCSNPAQKNDINFSKQDAESALKFAVDQYRLMIPVVPDSLQPRSTNTDGSTNFVKPADWTSGFYPGILWMLFESSGDELFKSEALKKTAIQEKQQFNGETHDLGFMLYNSYGQGLRIAQVEGYSEILKNGAKTLAGRYNPAVGCIKSWDWSDDKWQFPVIVDNMMNLEYLFWAFKVTGDSIFMKIALSHADKTIINHYRPDFSSWHVLNYDTLSGKVLEKVTHQGYSDESDWARGQAWGFYGFTMMYRETGNPKYLTHAQRIAGFLLNHANIPDDLVPYWDLKAPNIPHEPRDASAAAITASALLELSRYVDQKTASEYHSSAVKILYALSSEKYRAELGDNNHFILKHSVGYLPGNSEIDTPIIYADYYYIEALMRYLKS